MRAGHKQLITEGDELPKASAGCCESAEQGYLTKEEFDTEARLEDRSHHVKGAGQTGNGKCTEGRGRGRAGGGGAGRAQGQERGRSQEAQRVQGRGSKGETAGRGRARVRRSPATQVSVRNEDFFLRASGD